jgi:hypothetical protein
MSRSMDQVEAEHPAVQTDEAQLCAHDYDHTAKKHKNETLVTNLQPRFVAQRKETGYWYDQPSLPLHRSTITQYTHVASPSNLRQLTRNYDGVPSLTLTPQGCGSHQPLHPSPQTPTREVTPSGWQSDISPGSNYSRRGSDASGFSNGSAHSYSVSSSRQIPPLRSAPKVPSPPIEHVTGDKTCGCEVDASNLQVIVESDNRDMGRTTQSMAALNLDSPLYGERSTATASSETDSLDSSDNPSIDSDLESLCDIEAEKERLLHRLMLHVHEVFSSRYLLNHTAHESSGVNSSSIPAESSGGNSKDTGSKRRADGWTGGDDQGDNESGDRARKRRLAQDECKNIEPSNKKLACPYYKRNPYNLQLPRACGGPGWDDIPRLK